MTTRPLVSRRWSRRLTFALIAVVAVFAAAELIVRLGGWATLPAEGVFTDVYDVNYEMLPGAINPWSDVREFLNNDGFRGKSLPIERRDGIARIVSCGDSTTFGACVRADQAYTPLLENKLNARGVVVEALNAGVPGTNLWQQTLLFERRLQNYRPDLVILYTAPNLRADLARLRGGLRSGAIWRDVRRGLARSHIYRLLRHLIRPPSFEDVLHQYLNQETAADRWAMPSNEVYAGALEDLLRLQTLCESIDCRLLIMPVVSRALVYGANEHGLHPGDPAWSVRKSQDHPRRFILNITAKNDIATVDPADVLLTASYREPMFLDSVHFTPAGHEEVAELLLEKICAGHFLPDACP